MFVVDRYAGTVSIVVLEAVDGFVIVGAIKFMLLLRLRDFSISARLLDGYKDRLVSSGRTSKVSFDNRSFVSLFFPINADSSSSLN